MNKKPYSKALIIIVVLAIGVAFFAYFKSTRKMPTRKKPAQSALTVQTVKVHNTATKAMVSAMGTVIAARSITVFPQVNGRIVSQSKQLIPGGHLSRGQSLLRIDSSDYKLNVQSQQASVAQAKLNLALEEGRHAAAKLEWSLIEHEVKPTDEGLRLATREIQLESAKTALSAAESGLEKAKLNLKRTQIHAPFNAFVTNKNVDVGQVVSAQTPLAVLVDSDTFWVQLSVPVEKLRWIILPSESGTDGSTVKITKQIGKESIERSGRIIKLLANLDQMGKTAQLLVSIDDPFGLKLDKANNTKDHNLPLLLGTYVKVDIFGKTIDNVVSLPNGAIHEEANVWIFNSQSRLEIRPVEMLWRTAQAVYVRGNLKDAEAVITSRIQIPVPGMELLLSANSSDEVQK